MRLLFPWLIALLAVWLTLAVAHFTPHDGDGWLYSRMAAEISRHGFSELFAVKWYGLCQIYDPSAPEARYFYEHPPGMFFLPYALATLGLPAAKVTLFADTLYQLGALALVALLTRKVASAGTTYLMIVALLLLPISFEYALRATQETPLLTCMLAALTIVAYTGRFRAVTFLGLSLVGAAGALIKGIMILPTIVVATFAAGILAQEIRRKSHALLTASALSVGAYLALTAFDKIHIFYTGESFWRHYLEIQLWHRAIEPIGPLDYVWRTVRNVAFYVGGVAWFSQPWFTAFGYSLWRRPALVLRMPAAAWIGFFAAGLHILLFAALARTSIRYIFPTYTLMGFACVLMLVRRFPVLESWSGPRLMSAAACFWGISRGVVILMG